MQDLTAKRTLVKSPPELWSELSEVERLARHLGAFGEIKITRLEPERTVAWEGEGASGTVSIEPSGWGTKVTLTARIEGEEPRPSPSPSRSPSRSRSRSPSPSPSRSRTPPSASAACFALAVRLGAARPRAAGEQPVWVAGAPVEPRRSRSPSRSRSREPEPSRNPSPTPKTAAGLNRDGAQAVLEDALEALGSAHHRPFSRG